MDVFITGGSGFVGRALSRALSAGNNTVTVLSRSTKAAARLDKGIQFCLGDPTEPGPWQDEAACAQVIINLAGASIFGRWTKGHRRLITDSRVLATRHLVQAMARRTDAPDRVLISASAVGYYGPRGDAEIDESSEPGDDFLAGVCRAWEAEAMAAEEFGVRVARTRFGIVLGKDGGALNRMLPIFRMGLGGRLGSGKQWFSWIHQKDLVTAILFILARTAISGGVNLTAPNPVRNKELTKELGRVLRRPAILPAPGFALRLILGSMASMLLTGQRVMPKKLLAEGFEFHHPTIASALEDLLRPKKDD